MRWRPACKRLPCPLAILHLFTAQNFALGRNKLGRKCIKNCWTLVLPISSLCLQRVVYMWLFFFFSKSRSGCDRCCCPQWNTLEMVPFEALNWSLKKKKKKSPFLYCVNALYHCLSLSLSLFFSTNQYLVSTLITNNCKEKGPGPLGFANSLPGWAHRAHRESAWFYFLQHCTLQKTKPHWIPISHRSVKESQKSICKSNEWASLWLVELFPTPNEANWFANTTWPRSKKST